MGFSSLLGYIQKQWTWGLILCGNNHSNCQVLSHPSIRKTWVAQTMLMSAFARHCWFPLHHARFDIKYKAQETNGSTTGFRRGFLCHEEPTKDCDSVILNFYQCCMNNCLKLLRCLDLSDNDLIKLGNFPPLKRLALIRVHPSCYGLFFTLSSGPLHLAGCECSC